ncbi:MAG: hypothetical protein F6K28_24210 [Microcoleus sp. SIO2G3]|nr:hypothetical protein [Microcoleus sp. SIO2G3]
MYSRLREVREVVLKRDFVNLHNERVKTLSPFRGQRLQELAQVRESAIALIIQK